MARATIVLIVALVASVLAPGRSGWILMEQADAQLIPTPTLPPIIGDPEPSPSPSSGGGKPSGGGGGGGGGGNTSSAPKVGSQQQQHLPTAHSGGSRAPLFTGTYRPAGGAWSSDKLVEIAARLQGLGWSGREVMEAVYPPFIVAGEAVWTDTWGAPRFGPGNLVRRHEGQDVFCTMGVPVLAAESGRVSFGEGGLGGLVARLHRKDGSYWYYAHLSAFNTELRNGDRVREGQVIGYCGNTGNALTTPPHVHFGWYGKDGARNPLRHLAGWLALAEHRAVRSLARATGKRVAAIDRLIARRRFGDAFMPSLGNAGNPSLLAAALQASSIPAARWRTRSMPASTAAWGALTN